MSYLNPAADNYYKTNVDKGDTSEALEGSEEGGRRAAASLRPCYRRWG